MCLKDQSWDLYYLYCLLVQLYKHLIKNRTLLDVQSINDDLVRINQWSHTNGLLLNTAKTQSILFSKSHSQCLSELKFVVGESELTQCNEVKNLGIILNNNLKWSNHAINICQKVYNVLFRDLLNNTWCKFNCRVRVQ